MSFFSRKKLEPGIEYRGVNWSVAGDWYYVMLRAQWWLVLLVVVVIFLLLNLAFAFGYERIGGVFGARPGHFSDLFFFSVHTMGTIGYGSMYPASTGAHLLATCEALIGILTIALSTGVVFAKFSVVRARVRFASFVVISPLNGVPTLMFRFGHERASPVVDVMIRVIVTRTEHTAEGVLMYRSYDLELERDHAPVLSRAWMIMHCITETSPLYGASPSSFAKDEIEVMVAIRGTDETSGQTMHARRRYLDHEVRWGARHADMLSERPDGVFVVDMTHFDETVPTEPTSAFPYPARSARSSSGPRANLSGEVSEFRDG